MKYLVVEMISVYQITETRNTPIIERTLKVHDIFDGTAEAEYYMDNADTEGELFILCCLQ